MSMSLIHKYIAKGYIHFNTLCTNVEVVKYSNVHELQSVCIQISMRKYDLKNYTKPISCLYSTCIVCSSSSSKK